MAKFDRELTQTALKVGLVAGAILCLGAKATETDPEIVTRESMVAISKQLGVTCTHCHDTKNFRSASMPTFKIAKEHMRITAQLNSKQGFDGRPKVDCTVCHRGEAKPPATFKDFAWRLESNLKAESEADSHSGKTEAHAGHAGKETDKKLENQKAEEKK